MSAHRRLVAPAALALAMTVLGACSGAAATLSAPPSVAPIAAAATAAFTIALLDPEKKTFGASPTPAVASCRTPATGPWSFLYTATAFGTTPFLSVDLSIPDGELTRGGSSHFRLDVEPGDMPTYFVDPDSIKSGSDGSTGMITVTRDAAGAHVTIAAKAVVKTGSAGAGKYQTLTMDLTCSTPA
jgi:hypothetical protein